MERKFTVTAYYEHKGKRKSISRNFPSQAEAERWIGENKSVEVLVGGTKKVIPFTEYVIVLTETEVIALCKNG